MRKVIVITGPTASGKTNLSIALAKKYHLDIINGDSVQIYKRCNIGSAKITEEEKQGVKHHLLDILPPGTMYSVADFQKDAREILDQNPVSMVVGGTGLYIKALLTNYEFLEEKRNPEFEEKYEQFSNEDLYQRLQNIDYEASINIHPNNRKRVLRALEVSENSSVSFSSRKHNDEYLYDACIIVLTQEREKLYDTINQRVRVMCKEGLEEEVKSLYDDGIYIDAIGYKEWEPYFSNQATLLDVIDSIQKNTRHLAKKQLTFFKNQFPNAHFILVDKENIEIAKRDIFHIVDSFLNENKEECK